MAMILQFQRYVITVGDMKIITKCRSTGNEEVNKVGFMVLAEVRVEMAFFWVIALCKLV
jgi:hypothetical protein